jgi:hypothetical protein
MKRLLHNSLLLSFCAVVVALASSLTASAQAQAPSPTLYRYVHTQIKPEMLNEWLDLQKNEVIPALKKAGQTTRVVYVASLFGNTYEYVTITPFAKYADFDGDSPVVKALGQAATDRLVGKLRKCVASQYSYSGNRLTDISNATDGPPPEIAVFVRYRIASGKMTDFRDLMKSDVLPVYKKANARLFVTQRGVGANVNDVTMTTGYAKYADLDGGSVLVKQLGVDGAAKINAKFASFRTLVEVVVRKRVADLSF